MSRDSTKPHVFRRNGRWMVYLPATSFGLGGEIAPAVFPLLGASITEHRRAAGFMR